MTKQGSNSRARAIGRPRFADARDGERNPIHVRTTADMKRRLIAASTANGRSLAQEVEVRIEQTFPLEDLIKARLISMRRMPAGSKAVEEDTDAA